MSECSVCNNPRTPMLVEKVRKNVLTMKDAATELDVSYPMMWHHMQYHEQIISKSTADTDIDTMSIMKDVTGILLSLLKDIKDKRGGPEIKAVNETIKNIRGTLMDVERLTGRLRSAPFIQLQRITILNEKLMNFLLTKQCNDCKKKAIVMLESVGDV